MCSGVDHTVLPANHTTPEFTRSSPGCATTEWTVIAPADEAYYSFIDPVRMKGWVGLIGWPTADGLPMHKNGYPSAAGPVQTSESSPVRDRCSTTEPPNQQYGNNMNMATKCHCCCWWWFFLRRCHRDCQACQTHSNILSMLKYDYGINIYLFK